MEFIVSLLLGAILGVGSSLAAWWILFHRVVPYVEFSPRVSTRAASRGEVSFAGCVYRIKIGNPRKRGAIDISIFARLRVRGGHIGLPTNWAVIHIPVARPCVPWLRGSTIVHLLPSRLTPEDLHGFNQDLVNRADSGSLTLEELLESGSAAELDIFVFGYDEFSGSRRMFISPIYQRQDLVPWLFRRGASCEMITPGKNIVPAVRGATRLARPRAQSTVAGSVEGWDDQREHG